MKLTTREQQQQKKKQKEKKIIKIINNEKFIKINNKVVKKSLKDKTI